MLEQVLVDGDVAANRVGRVVDQDLVVTVIAKQVQRGVDLVDQTVASDGDHIVTAAGVHNGLCFHLLDEDLVAQAAGSDTAINRQSAGEEGVVDGQLGDRGVGVVGGNSEVEVCSLDAREVEANRLSLFGERVDGVGAIVHDGRDSTGGEGHIEAGRRLQRQAGQVLDHDPGIASEHHGLGVLGLEGHRLTVLGDACELIELLAREGTAWIRIGDFLPGQR